MVPFRRFVLSGLLVATTLHAQSFTANDYRKALWMTTRFYGGQRSGQGPNWLIMDHGSGKDFTGDVDGDHDLSGGWHDCGDHVKFGQTEFYSAFVLLTAYAEFPQGFGDHYSFDYRGYRQSGDFTWEGGKGIPNGIPDVLDEIKYACDYFIKCARDNATFYYQVGEGDKDHKQWVTSVKMATLAQDQGGQPRRAFKNPTDASMASLCGATLALMSRVYRRFDAPYADRCLVHAKYAYSYAKAHPGTQGAADGAFYPANARWQDDFATMVTELLAVTGDEFYLQDAVGVAGSVTDHHWSLCYNNNDDLALYNLAKLNFAGKKSALTQITQRYRDNVNGQGVFSIGNQWGILRYSVGQAFSAALCAKLLGSTGLDPNVVKTVDYVMGRNSANQSFIVGFSQKYPRHPHHRNVFLNDQNVSDAAKNSLEIPERNRQFGCMVGGSLDPNTYVDDINDYRYSEGGIDYNCGLVGALAYIVATLQPVDTSKLSIIGAIPERDGFRYPPADEGAAVRRFSITGRIAPAPADRSSAVPRNRGIPRIVFGPGPSPFIVITGQD